MLLRLSSTFGWQWVEYIRVIYRFSCVDIFRIANFQMYKNLFEYGERTLIRCQVIGYQCTHQEQLLSTYEHVD